MISLYNTVHTTTPELRHTNGLLLLTRPWSQVPTDHRRNVMPINLTLVHGVVRLYEQTNY
jgi:hypothetical protein